MKKSVATQRSHSQSDEKLQHLGAKAIITKIKKKRKKNKSEFRHQMRSGVLPAFLFESSFKWHSFMFSPFMFSPFLGNDLRTDGPADRRTDTASYRDARTHLKIILEHTQLIKRIGYEHFHILNDELDTNRINAFTK